MEVVALLSQGRTAAAQCGLFTHKSVPVILEPPCITQRVEVISYWRFGTTCWSHLQESVFLTLEEETDSL